MSTEIEFKLDLQDKMEKLSTRVEPRYRDAKQMEYNQLITELECRVLSGFDRNFFGKLSENIAKLVSDEEGFLRFLQSVIELTGLTTVSCNDIFNVHYWQLRYLPDANFSLAKIFDLIRPYLQIRSKCQCSEITVKQRNVCIALNIVANNFKYDEVMTTEIVSFLSRILNESDNKLSLLYAISCLSLFASNSVNKLKISKETEIMENLKHYQYYLDSYTFPTFYIVKFDYVSYQIGFLSRWCLDTIQGSSSVKLGEIESKSSLNPTDCNLGIRLSPDRLSVRSEGFLQFVRASYPVTCNVFYYEVIVLTSGHHAMGWNSKQNTLSKLLEKYSITFNSYANRIYSDKEFETKNKICQAGDVIGCLIDVPNKKVAFYLNGELVINQLSVPFSTEPYFAVICISTFQHCYCNFGQVPFKYPPPSVTYRTFHGSISKYINDKLCPFCNLKPTGARFVNCDHWKLCSDCLVKLKKCPTCNE